MKQTPNYGLNQWELGDRIRMEDFNADNDITDTILAELDGELDEKLGRASLYWSVPATPGSTTGPSTINPSGLVDDWSNYEYLVLMVDIPEGNPQTGSPLEIQIGNNPCETVATIPEDSFIVIFRSRRNASSKVQGTILSANGVKFFTCQTTFSQLDHMFIVPTTGRMSSTGLTFVGFR